VRITEVRVKLVDDRSERVKAYCTITLDDEFVIRDVKVIEGAKGLFIAMPSRKLTDRCPACGGKNHLKARFCNDCGARLPDNRTEIDEQGREKLHADIAHPVSTSCRREVEKHVLAAYREEIDRSTRHAYGNESPDDFGQGEVPGDDT